METVAINCNHCGAPIEVSPRTRFVTCAHCGSPLAVHRGEGSVYTERLEEIDRRTANIEDRTTEIQDRVERLSLQAELEELDRDWERERERYMVTDSEGRTTEPSSANAALGLVAAVVFGIIALVMFASFGSSTRGMLGSGPRLPSAASGSFSGTGPSTYTYEGGTIRSTMRGSGNDAFGSAFGVLSCLVPLLFLGAILAAGYRFISHTQKADAFAKAERAYEQRRSEIVIRMTGD